MQEIKFYETYYFCNVIRNVLYDQPSFLRKLDEFYGDGAHFYLLDPFERYSAFHKFIEFIVDSVYYEKVLSIDLKGRKRTFDSFTKIPSALKDIKPHKLPIELALGFYQIGHESFECYLKSEGKDFFSCDEDDIHEYMCEVKSGGAYEELIDQTVKETFHILFQNRDLMLHFNRMVSCVFGGGEHFIPEGLEHLFKMSGVLERKHIPKWVQRAVYFRDRGRCVLCDKDLSSMLNLENLENYDHMVPLARYGLNDVSNIQLLCRECNQEKRAENAITSSKYQAWYRYDDT